jgi:hypothetical protein
VTINAARQIGQGDRLGSLEKGKEADFTILEMGERAARYCVIPRSRALVPHMIVRRLPLPWPGPFGTARSLRFQNPAMGARKGERGRALIGTDITGDSGLGCRASAAQPLGKTFQRHAICFSQHQL